MRITLLTRMAAVAALIMVSSGCSGNLPWEDNTASPSNGYSALYTGHVTAKQDAAAAKMPPTVLYVKGNQATVTITIACRMPGHQADCANHTAIVEMVSRGAGQGAFNTVPIPFSGYYSNGHNVPTTKPTLLDGGSADVTLPLGTYRIRVDSQLFSPSLVVRTKTKTSK